MSLSVVICSHNPKKDILTKAIDALKIQTLPLNTWELIVVDNLSDLSIAAQIDLSWHPQSKIITEKKLGLSHARLCGVNASSGELIVFVDDDNLLAPDFLVQALIFHQQYPQVGSFGGKALPKFEIKPPDWFFKTGISLGCRDLGNQMQISNFRSNNFKITHYPKFAPIGTGMVILKQAFQLYIEEVGNNKDRLNLGRKGNALTSGEDNDIVLTLIKKGYEIAYVPELKITHLIPNSRLSIAYLNKMAFEINRSWVKVLALHGINPWETITTPTLPLRKMKAYLKNKAWQSPLNYIKWRAACGKFKGLSEINF